MIRIKTTREIINQTPKFNINDAKEKLDYHFNTKWFSEEEILDAIKKVQNSNKLFNDFETDFLNILFNAPDLNSSSDKSEIMFNKSEGLKR